MLYLSGQAVFQTEAVAIRFEQALGNKVIGRQPFLDKKTGNTGYIVWYMRSYDVR